MLRDSLTAVPVSSSWREPQFRRFTSRRYYERADIPAHRCLTGILCALSDSGSQLPPVKSVLKTRFGEPGDDAPWGSIVLSLELMYLSTLILSTIFPF